MIGTIQDDIHVLVFLMRYVFELNFRREKNSWSIVSSFNLVLPILKLCCLIKNSRSVQENYEQ